MALRIRTIEDMEKVFYSRKGAQLIQKADEPVISTTTGVYNAIYGAQVWAWLNQEVNVWGILPKYPFPHSGWRVIESRADAISSPVGGRAENAALPDTGKPVFREISTKPKTVAHTFEVSELQNFLAQNGDDAIADMAFMRSYMGREHVEHINAMLMADVDTVAGDNIDSVDRVCSSKSEEDALLNGADADIYGLDRSSATTFDAFVSHNTGADRDLTDELILTAITTILENSGYRPTVIITGHDTFRKIAGIYQDQIRYVGALTEVKVAVGVNGLETEGFDAGKQVASLYGIPLVVSNVVVKDTISRIYFLNTTDPLGFGRPLLGIAVARPTQYFEAGIDVSGDPFGINKFGNEGLYRTMAELICTNFKAQGKIRDLQ